VAQQKTGNNRTCPDLWSGNPLVAGSSPARPGGRDSAGRRTGDERHHRHPRSGSQQFGERSKLAAGTRAGSSGTETCSAAVTEALTIGWRRLGDEHARAQADRGGAFGVVRRMEQAASGRCRRTCAARCHEVSWVIGRWVAARWRRRDVGHAFRARSRRGSWYSAPRSLLRCVQACWRRG
jgi:hypothetical protein